MRTRSLLLILVAAISVTGCAGKGKKWHFADMRPRLPWSKKDAKPSPEVPSRLVATWIDTTLHKTGQVPQRGFGGRVVFFAEENEDPVRVEGQFVVYAFEESSSDRAPYQTEPTRRFIFPQEQFALHESDSKLGASYSVWLPWDDVGGPPRKISLIARFEPKEGPAVMGEQTHHLLPGVAPAAPPAQLAAQAAAAPAAAPPQGVALAAYAEHSILDPSGSLPSAGMGATSTGDPKSPERSRYSSRSAGEGGSQPAGVVPATALTRPGAPLQQMATMTIPLPRSLSKSSPLRQQAAAAPAAPQQQLQAQQAPWQQLPAQAPSAQQQTPPAAQEQSPARPGASPQGITAAANASAAVARPLPTGPRSRAESLRDSLLSTLPARVVPGAQPTPDRAR